MQDHAVVVDHTPTPSTIVFAPIFNVAVPFIDRHLSEGRSEKAAIRTVAGDVTYGELAEQVNRCGNVLREMGARTGRSPAADREGLPRVLFSCSGGRSRPGSCRCPSTPCCARLTIST